MSTTPRAVSQIVFELPFSPISVNGAYATDFKTKRRFKTAKYTAFTKNCVPYLPKERIKGRVEIELNFYFPDKRRRDLDNYIKSMLDTLVLYGVIEDDSNVHRLVAEKYYDKNNPATVIKIVPFKTKDVI